MTDLLKACKEFVGWIESWYGEIDDDFTPKHVGDELFAAGRCAKDAIAKATEVTNEGKEDV